MKTFSHTKILAGTCALALAACNAVEDVPNENTADPPAQTVVLSGTINGLSSLRSITLQNNDDTINTKSFINAAPTVPNEGVRPVLFSFGAVPVGSAYRITVKDQPEFKTCVVVNGTGVITLGVRPDVVVNCDNQVGVTRYNLTVNFPSDANLFRNKQGASIRVTTEEEIREIAVASVPVNVNSVTFNNVLVSALGALNAATYTVTASTFEGNRINKCVVTNPSGTNPVANVTNAVVGAVTAPSVDAALPPCQFTVSGRVAYSLPPGATTIPPISGLKLQLRDLQLNAIETLDVACAAPPATVTNSAAPSSTTTLGAVVPVPGTAVCTYTFLTPVRSSTTDGVYEVAVSQQPVGQACVMTNAGSVSVFTQGVVSPRSIVDANVFCRDTPPTNRRLSGVFRLKSTVFNPNALAGAAPLTNTWVPFDLTQWNTASSNMMAFYPNGTFMYGSHGNGAQVEHGFYDYDPTNQRLRFTLIVDTDRSTAFPANFSGLPTIAPTATFTQITNLTNTTPGISALPNPIRQNGATALAPATATPNFAASHAAMTGVTFGTANSGLGTVRTISGTFGADPAGIASYFVNATTACSAAAPCINPTTGATITKTACTGADPCIRATTGLADVTGPNQTTCVAPSAPCYMPNYAYRVSWVLEEPPQVNNEMTGAWLAQDSRRLWVWDYRTYYGTAVGMTGGSPTMNDACFTIEDLHVSSGIYTRRGSGTGCFPYSRPANDAVSGVPGLFPSRNGTLVGYFLGTAESVDLSLSTAPLIQLPGFTGRHPGGEPAPGLVSPSPIYFHVAPAATFFSSANATYFPSASTSWCTTQILGLRATANGFPINYPIYYCRTSASLP